MRIAHVTEAWNGGISTYVNSLIRHQKEAGHTVGLVYSPSQARSNFDPAVYQSLDVQIMPYTSSRNPLKIFQSAGEIRWALADFKPDIVHLHSTFAGVYGRVLRPEFPVVYCAHGWSFTEEDGAVKRFIYRIAEQFFARRSDAIINISQREYNNAKARGIHAPIHCAVLNGVEDTALPLPAIDFKNDPNVLNLGYIGRLDPKKGFDLLHGYFRYHKPDGVHLTVIGEASRSEADYTNDDTDGITYLGWVNAEEIDSYIRQCDAIIVPSRHEGFGLVVIEAMRNGVPAVVARDTAMPEMVTYGVDGFIFDIADFRTELDIVLRGLDKGLLKEMGVRARKTYETRFTASRMANDIMDVYDSVLYKRDKAS